MSGSAAAVLTKPAFRKIEWLARDIAVERRPDGVIILKSRIPLQAYNKHIPASLAKWAKDAPERIWLAQRGGPERQWRKVSYGEAKRTVDGLTQGLLNLGVEDGTLGLHIAVRTDRRRHHRRAGEQHDVRRQRAVGVHVRPPMYDGERKTLSPRTLPQRASCPPDQWPHEAAAGGVRPIISYTKARLRSRFPPSSGPM